MKKDISIALIDNFDSFTYNLYHYIQPHVKKADVIRYDKTEIAALQVYNGIILSPGPGLPKDFPLLKEIILDLGKNIPVLGVCLGHQAIAEAYGGKLFNMKEVWHGVARNTVVVKRNFLFRNIRKNFISGRYHSWAVNIENLPNMFIVTAKDDDGTIMAIQHKSLPVTGIQFHPESVLTPCGRKIMKNWVEGVARTLAGNDSKG